MDMLLRNPEYTGKIGYICEYDPVTVMSKHTHYNDDGSVGYRAEYEYDSAGNEIRNTSYLSDGSIDYWDVYEYVTITPLKKAAEVTKEG